jgi:hypothetical protein
MKPLYHKLIIAIFIFTCSISCNSQDEQVEEPTSLPTVQELKLLTFNVWQKEQKIFTTDSLFLGMLQKYWKK